MTVQEILQSVQFDDRLAVEMILAHALHVSKEHLFAHPEQKINSKQEAKFYQLFDRLLKGEPVAYCIGKKEFFGLDFFVDSSVLIPRPETEMLVELVLQFASGADRPYTILDIGTGSGAIAIALAKNLPAVKVVATDISDNALSIARKNADKHDVSDRISFMKADLLEGIEGPFDIVIANLPYIGEEKFRFVSREALEYEPQDALFGGEDGLELYRKLFAQYKEKGWKSLLLAGEFGFLQGQEMRNILNKFFVQDVWRIEKDYASIERIFVIRYPYHD